MASATPEQDAAAAAIDNAAAASASASTPDGDTSDEPQQQQQRQNNQRPSFEDFWRRSKAARRAGNVTFLPSVGVVGKHACGLPFSFSSRLVTPTYIHLFVPSSLPCHHAIFSAPPVAVPAQDTQVLLP